MSKPPMILGISLLLLSLFSFPVNLHAQTKTAFGHETPEPRQEALRSPEMRVTSYSDLLSSIRELRNASQRRIETAVEQEKVREAWETGKLIDEHILLHKERAAYGQQVLSKLAKDLDTSQSELSYMLQFARAYSIYPPADKLGWAHYRELLSINNKQERESLAQEAVRSNWKRADLRREIKKRKISSSSPAPNASAGDPQLEQTAPGKPGIYRVVEMKGRKYYDLGFSIYIEIKNKAPKETNPPASELYFYNAEVTQTVDGDTFHALVDLGFGIVLEQRLRLRQLDAPEIVSSEGKEAQKALEKVLMRDHGKILLKVSKCDDQYGRYLVDVWVNGQDINQTLLDSEVFTVRSGD